MVQNASTVSSNPEMLIRRRDEFLGISLAVAAALLAGALISHHPGDPSLFSFVSSPGARPENWIGRFGASFSEGALQMLGYASYLMPLALLLGGIRRFLSRPITAWGTKILGLTGLALTLASAAHLLWGRPPRLGGGVSAGGYLGDLTGSALVAAFNVPGASLVLVAAGLTSLLFATSLSLGEIFGKLSALTSDWIHQKSVDRDVRREREKKEALKREVVKKHVERAREQLDSGEIAAPRPSSPAPAASPEREGADIVYVPRFSSLRVSERVGAGKFSIQKASPIAIRTGTVSTIRTTPAVRALAPAPAPTPATAPSVDQERPAEAVRPSVPDLAPNVPTPSPVPVIRPAELKKEPTDQRVLPFPSPKESNGWIFPPEKLLRAAPKRDREKSREEFQGTMELINSKCMEFGVEGIVDTYRPGPVVTTYEFRPSAGVKVSKIASLENDLALALAAEKVRIERIPGRAVVGIEVPNRHRELISLREVIESEKFRRSPSLLTIALGLNCEGEPMVGDLARMPHLLVAGMTGAGKSVGVNGMITSILFKARPDEVKFIFVDPKMNDMKDYEDIPHLLVPVIIDPKKAANALKWAVDEMEGRYKLLSEWPGVRNIEQYNAAIKDPEAVAEVQEKIGDKLKMADGVISPMPYIVIVIDELADLMMTAPKDIEESVARLAQKARAVGLHLILATQRPSVDVITGTIKANLPCRIAYTTRTKIDSRTILDATGAEALLGQGDMLYLAPGTSYLDRTHGGFIGGDEIKDICRFLKKQAKPLYDEAVVADRDPAPEAGAAGGRISADDNDPMFDTAARLVVRERMASISFLQRRLEIGFSRAGKLIDMMERDGLVGPRANGSKSRDVLVSPDYFDEIDRQRGE
jgi:S-DNA-T family DNA segregation ATPase FtsK/SpoIIIE